MLTGETFNFEQGKSNLLIQNVSTKSGSWRENSSVEMCTTCHARKQLTEINAIN